MDAIETPTLDRYVKQKLKRVQRAKTPKGRLKAVLEYDRFVKEVNDLWKLEK